jgi:hypothetical protein
MMSVYYASLNKINRLSVDVRNIWTGIAGPTVDYSEQIQNFWAFSEAIHESDFLALAVPIYEVDSLSMHTVNRFLTQLTAIP